MPMRQESAKNLSQRKKSESSEQIALVAWAWYKHRLICVHCPTELMRFLNEGQKIHQMKMGTKVGWPDLFVCLPKIINGNAIGGLFIEMKSKTGILTPQQEKWRLGLLNAFYGYEVCRSFEEGQKAILDYMGRK